MPKVMVNSCEDYLHTCAEKLEDSKGLKEEVAVWESEFVRDGLKDI